MDTRAQRLFRHGIEGALGALLIATLVWVGWSFGVSVGAPGAAVRTGEPPAGGRLRSVQNLPHFFEVNQVAWSPDGRFLASGGPLNRTVMVWEVRTGTVWRRLDREVGSVATLAWSADGRRLAAGRGFTRLIPGRVAINVWDAATGALLHNLPGPIEAPHAENDVRAMAFSPDGRFLASARAGGAVVVHDMASGSLAFTISGDVPVRTVVAYSPDGRYLATSGKRGVSPVQLHDAATGALVRAFPGDTGMPMVLAYRPDGRHIATAEYENAIITIWDAATGEAVNSLGDYAAPITALTYSPDSRWLVAGTAGAGLVLWEARTGRPLEVFQGASGRGDGAIFSPDGRHLAQPDGDSVRIWELVSPPAGR